jgi:HK97 family phage major capsid protein
MPALDKEDIAVIQGVRTELVAAIESGMKDQAAKLEVKLNELVDASTKKQETAHAEEVKKYEVRITDLEAWKKDANVRLSKYPNGGDFNPTQFKTFGQLVVESEGFKACDFTGRFRMKTTIKTRIRDMKAAVPMTGGVVTPTVAPVGSFPILPVRVGIVPLPVQRLVMRDLMTVIPLEGTNAVEYVKEAWPTVGAGYQINEGDIKPASQATYSEYTATVRTIAHYLKLSRQMASDVPAIMTMLEQRLLYFVLRFEEGEILFGDNSAGHLWGIMPQATPIGIGTPAATFTVIDELRAAISQLENAFFEPTAIVLNPLDAATIETMKTTYGSYLLADRAPREDGLLRMWGLPVITTPSMPQGNYLVGAFPGNVALFDREQATVEMSMENEDDFIRNLITLRAEERVTLAVFQPNAFVKGPFKSLPIGPGTFSASDEHQHVPTPGPLPPHASKK